MPKIDSETGEPMSDAPDGDEETAGGTTVDPREQRDPGDDYAGSAS